MKTNVPALLFGILFLFFIQQISFLVESIYMLNLLNTSMDARALGILFFFSPIFLIFVRKRVPIFILYILVILFLTSSALSPWVSTNVRILSSGIAVSAFLLFLGMLLTTSKARQIPWFSSFAVTALLSLFFRTIGFTQDSLVAGPKPFFNIISIILAVILLKFLNDNDADHEKIESNQTHVRLFISALGFVSCLTLFYFAFISPTVITRWTESSYSLIISVYAISISLFFVAFLFFPIRYKLKKNILVVWTILFLLALILSIFSHTVQFAQTPGSLPIVVLKSQTIDVLAIITMILSPIIFINLTIFINNLQTDRPSQLALPLAVSFLFFTILIFMLIFTNVWGYVGDISLIFRNKFYLPFLVAGLGMIIPILLSSDFHFKVKSMIHKKSWAMSFVFTSFLVVFSAIKLDTARVISPEQVGELTIMSYNIQQGVDFEGNKNYENQLALILKIDPDIICLQESDVARISGGNSDVVRYFSQHLRYHSYYGPKTVTGTFGTAILSRFPLFNCRTIFSYSDVDEIGTSVAEVKIDEKLVAIFNSHPAGGTDAKHTHVDALIKNSKNYEYIIAAGDFNFRQGSPYYEKVAAQLQDSWLIRWPDGIGDLSTAGLSRGQFDNRFAKDEWLDEKLLRMDDRIDFIFLSDNFDVVNSSYLPVPESQSDHPAHWAIVRFAE